MATVKVKAQLDKIDFPGYKRVDLGSAGLSYIRSRLSDGLTLAEKIRAEKALGSDVYTYLPVNVREEELLNFEAGWKIKPREHEFTTVVDPAGQKWEVAPAYNTNWVLARIIFKLLASDKQLAWIFENGSAKKGDKYLQKMENRCFYFQDEVYHFLTYKDSLKEIEATIKVASTWILLGFLTAIPASLKFQRHDLPAADIALLAQNAKLVSVDAYDREANILCWLKD